MNNKHDITPFPFRMSNLQREALTVLAKKNNRSIQGELEEALLNHLDNNKKINSILDSIKQTNDRLEAIENMIIKIDKKL